MHKDSSSEKWKSPLELSYQSEKGDFSMANKFFKKNLKKFLFSFDES